MNAYGYFTLVYSVQSSRGLYKSTVYKLRYLLYRMQNFNKL